MTDLFKILGQLGIALGSLLALFFLGKKTGKDEATNAQLKNDVKVSNEITKDIDNINHATDKQLDDSLLNDTRDK